jgi:hypothetical protein
MDLQEMSILDCIRVRPAMYLGRRSLTALHDFLNGYSLGRHEAGMDKPRIIPAGFLGWIAYRLHMDISTMGYLPMILSKEPDESKALQCFFDLYDSYFKREAKVVATIKEGCRGYSRVTVQSGKSPERHDRSLKKIEEVESLADGSIRIRSVHQLPRSLKIVVYTDDPGCFLIADESEDKFRLFCPVLDYAGCYLGRTPARKFDILDQEIFARLMRENSALRKDLRKRRAQNSKQNAQGESSNATA